MGPCSARITQVAAWPTSGPSSGKSPRISEETLPSSRGLTLNVSMALATLGLVIFLRASICCVVSGTGCPPYPVVGWRDERLDRPFALLDERLLELLDHLLDLLQVGVGGERALEVGERLLGLVELE